LPRAMATVPPPTPSAFVRLPGVELACASLASRGLTTTAQPDGHVAIAAASVVAEGVRASVAGATIEIAQITLDEVRAEVMPVAGAPVLASFTVQRLAVERLQAALPRGAIAAGQPQPVRLDPLAALDGLVHAFVTDALWFVDADVTVPIRRGTIDFNAVEIEQVGPNALLGVSPTGIHVTGPAGQVRVPVVAFGPSPPPGVAVGTAGGFPFARGDRGRIDLLPFLQALLAAPPGQPLARPADPELSGALARTRLTGEVQLGDGTLARGGQRVDLAGRDAGKNRCTLESPSVAQRVVITLPQLHASAAAWSLPGRELRTAAVEAVVEAHVLGTAAPAGSPGVMLSIAEAVLREVAVLPQAGA